MKNLQFTIYNSLKKHCTCYIVHSKLNRGFTLIELLVTVAIIGILSAFMIANFVGARQRTRDAQRKSDLRQIQAAIEYYKADDGLYPPALPAGCGGEILSASHSQVYMKSLPCDPLTKLKYVYTCLPSAATCNSYELYACLENAKDQEKDTTDKCSGDTVSYTIRNPS